MNLFRLSQTNATSRIPLSTEQNFRPGQIIQGKIIKLYPEQKAEIQLGQQRMVAQLEVGLQLGKNYHFQVESSGDVLRLKVLGEQTQIAGKLDLTQLLSQLGVKQSQANVNFLKQLLQQQIPFDRSQISQATQILGEAKNKSQVMNVLLEMFTRNLPIKQSIFEGLMAVKNTSLNEGIKTVLAQMNQSLPLSTTSASNKPQVQIPSQQVESQIQTVNLTKPQAEIQLRQLLTTLSHRPEPFPTLLAKEIISQNQANQPGLFRVLQNLGHVPQNVSFKEWQATWSTFNQQTNLVKQQPMPMNSNPPLVNLAQQTPGNLQAIKSTMMSQTPGNVQATQSTPVSQTQAQQGVLLQTNQTAPVPLPFALNASNVLQDLTKLEAQRPQMTEAANKWVSKWGKETQFFVATGGKMPAESFPKMLASVVRDFAQLLSQNQLNQIQTMKNTPRDLAHLQMMMQNLQTEQQSAQIKTLLDTATANERFLNLNIKQQFMQQVQLTVNQLGLQYENQIAGDKNLLAQQETVKGLLLDMLAKPETSQSTTMKNLVTLINGLQVQSVQETPTYIQASLQVPAERFGLIDDMKLEFEGRKNEDGEINPDYCRILFHLELGALKETMIDMQVQNRSISIVVYNNTRGIEQLATPFKAKLTHNLGEIDYRLAQVQFKPIHEKTNVAPKYNWQQNMASEQGVDFRI